MTLVKINARDLIVQVQDSTPGVWLGVGGMTSATPNPSENEEEVDTTEFSSLGDAEGEIMQRGASLEIEGFQKLDNITGAPDPGQARCEYLATRKGYESLGSIRFRHPLQTTWKVWPQATFSVGEQGGGNNDKSAWAVTVKRSGASTSAAVA